MEDLVLNNISNDVKLKVAEHLKSIDFNESYIAHFLENADKEENPIEYILKKYPDLEL